MATLVDDLRWAQDGGGAFTNPNDLSPLFDIVDHRNSQNHLKEIGEGNIVLRWLSPFLYRVPGL